MRSTLPALFLLPYLAVVSPRAPAPQQGSVDFLTRQGIRSIAVLPALGDSVPSAARQLSADLFDSKLKLRNSALRILTPDEVTNRLQQQGATGDFSAMVTLLSQTGMVNTEAMKKIGQVAGADGLTVIDVLNYDEEKGSWWYGKGGKNVCRIQYSLFRASDGQKIWETLEFRQHDSKVSTNPYPMERVIGDVTDKAVTALLADVQHVDVRKKE